MRDAAPARRRARLPVFYGNRNRGQASLQRTDAADDEHGRDRHGVPPEKNIQCYGVGPATDTEDGPKGFGAHSDQERILETELHRFVQFFWDVVVDLARAK